MNFSFHRALFSFPFRDGLSEAFRVDNPKGFSIVCWYPGRFSGVSSDIRNLLLYKESIIHVEITLPRRRARTLPSVQTM